MSRSTVFHFLSILTISSMVGCIKTGEKTQQVPLKQAQELPMENTETVQQVWTRANWETRAFGNHRVPSAFLGQSASLRFIEGDAFSAYWRIILDNKGYMGKKVIAPQRSAMSSEDFEHMLKGTQEALWISGQLPLNDVIIKGIRPEKSLAISFPDVENISNKKLAAIDDIGHTLALDGLKTLTKEQVAILGRVTLKKTRRNRAVVEKPVLDKLLSLRGVPDISSTDLKTLAQANHGLWLSFPNGIDSHQAEALASAGLKELALFDLPSLDAKTAATFGQIGLKKLSIEVSQLDHRTAKALGQFQGEALELTIEKPLSEKAASRLGEKGRRPLILSVSTMPSIDALKSLAKVQRLTFRGPRDLNQSELMALAGNGGFHNIGPVSHVGNEAAQTLETSGTNYRLQGVESASAEAIKAGLGRWFKAEDIKRIDAKSARALGEKNIASYRIDSLSADTAEALITAKLASWNKRTRTLSISTQKALSAETAAILSRYAVISNKNTRLVLYSTEGFTPSVVTAFAECSLSKRGCNIEFQGIKSIDEELAKAFASLKYAKITGVENISAAAFPHLCGKSLSKEKSLTLNNDAQAQAYMNWRKCSHRKGWIKPNVDTLSPGMAKALSSNEEGLRIELDTIGAEAAHELTASKVLKLTINKSLDVKAAQALAGFKGARLDLHLKSPIDVDTAAALGKLTTAGEASIYFEVDMTADVLSAISSEKGRFNLFLTTSELTTAYAAALIRHPGTGKTKVHTQKLSTQAATAIIAACPKRKGCGRLDLSEITEASGDALKRLVDGWKGTELTLPNASIDGYTVPCDKKGINTHGCDEFRSMQEFENHDCSEEDHEGR